ncbi:MAG: hypothetical protein A2355_07935, partial [Spirochaetes bacterium RIFOXYB1_FULL_32_8]
YSKFLDKLFTDIQIKQINVSNFELDHIGYQCSSNEDYDNLKPEFEKIAKLVSENIVGGRRVGIFQLNSPINYKERSIPAIEIIAPKEGQICPSALEHAEFVINEDFESFVGKYSNLDWDKSKVSQPTFPMVNLKLSEFTQVKFHYTPVLEIVKSH